LVRQPLLAAEVADKFDILLFWRMAADPTGKPARGAGWALPARCSNLI